MRTGLIICPRVKVLLIEVEVVVQCEVAHPNLVGMGMYRVRVHPSSYLYVRDDLLLLPLSCFTRFLA
jgi:hypothetical protein